MNMLKRLIKDLSIMIVIAILVATTLDTSALASLRSGGATRRYDVGLKLPNTTSNTLYPGFYTLGANGGGHYNPDAVNVPSYSCTPSTSCPLSEGYPASGSRLKSTFLPVAPQP